MHVMIVCYRHDGTQITARPYRGETDVDIQAHALYWHKMLRAERTEAIRETSTSHEVVAYIGEPVS